jgi:uncharacterized protein YndB with AHSA1/START domain
MRWLAYAAVAIVALVLVVAIVGALLPRDHVVAAAARIAAPPADVWKVVTDPAAFPTWRPDVKRVDVLPAAPNGGRLAWREHGGNGAIAFAVDAAEPPSRLVTRITDDGLPFGGSWEWRIAADGDGASRVTIVERGSVHNPIFRFASRFVLGHDATMNAQLRALGRRFGAAADPRPIEGIDDGA